MGYKESLLKNRFFKERVEVIVVENSVYIFSRRGTLNQEVLVVQASDI